MGPRLLFRVVAVAEAVTWALLLAGMFLKYVTETTEVGVQVGGMLHGVVFVAYCVTTVVVAVDGMWSAGRTTRGLLAAVPPFFTVWFDVAVERRGGLEDHWRLRTAQPDGRGERLLALLLRRPWQGLAAGVIVVVGLTALALLVGPPV